MVYDIVIQHDHNLDVDDEEIASTSLNPQRRLASPVLTPLSTHGLFLDDSNTRIHHGQEEYRSQRQNADGRGLNYMVQSIASRSSNSKTNTSYDMLEEDDFANDVLSSPALSGNSKGPSDPPLHLHIPRARRSSPATKTSRILPLSPSKEPIVRTASGRSLALRHPTPDLQVLQGAYKGNIVQLEKTAEELSMTSSIDHAIKQLHDEQKRSDSRRSSLLSSQGMQAISRQVSNASSIVEVNSAARSGGFSPAAPYLMSPKGSLSGTAGGRNRSASKSSRFGTRPEPELEGRPLDSFVNVHSMHSSSMSPTSAHATSIAEQEEESSTLTREVFALLKGPTKDEPAPKAVQGNARPSTSASTIYDNPEAMFEGFDGTHVEPIPPPPSPPPEHHISFSEVDSAILESNTDQRRVSSGNRLSMARPQSYADPVSGQQMVYYPAPVPMMLNLPQKLSKMPSSMARNKRRSQLLENIPAATRQSAIWLPDVLENEDEAGLPEDDEAQHQEYIPQHQRASMGGRRLTADLSHMAPQLRASTFFDLPGSGQIVELKEHSAVATLDSILDASAHAPVSAFTDHAFAGHLGAEVYGRTSNRNSRSSTQLLDPQKKRNSSSTSCFEAGELVAMNSILMRRDVLRCPESSKVQSGLRLRTVIARMEM